MIPLANVRVLATGFRGAEGVAVDRDGFVWGGGNDGVIRKLSPDGRLSEVAKVEGLPCGLAFDRGGELFVASAGVGVLAVSPSGAVRLVADRADDVRLVAANFPVFGADGSLYVSNSTDFAPTDMERFMAELSAPAPKGSIVRIRPNGKADVVARGLYFANGLAIDPGEEALYVLQSTRQDCLRLPLRADGTLGPADPYGGALGALCDGCAFDSNGDLIVTLPMNHRVVALAR
ncbi:MAG: SMP-30/gluconolactonase/LRE family protein, partial [Candidatus Binatia bacterium]